VDKSLINSNPVLKHSFDFAFQVINYCELLQSQKKFIVSNQLLKSGTSIGANIMEAQNAESKADFIHKMKIAAKEAEETQYWLMLCSYSQGYPPAENLLQKLREIHNLLGKILSTAKRKSPFVNLLTLILS
jgi:four helix bundle protein